MKKSVSIGWGGSLHLLGSELGPRTIAQTLVNSPGVGGGNETNVTNEWEATGSAGIFNDYYLGVYGGPLSMLPGGMSNHKPGEFLFGQFYYQAHRTSNHDSHTNPQRGCFCK